MMVIILFMFGTIIGSFLNVVVLRLNSGLSLGGRSKCPHCGKTLRFYELIPIFSFLSSAGRCRGCRAKISWQYPLVELWSGLVFATVFDPAKSQLLNALMLAVFCLFIALAAYDFRHKIIPDKLVYLAIGIAFLCRLLVASGPADFWAGPAFALFFFLIWLLSKGRAMGFADAKLALAIGWLLGLEIGLSAIVLSFWIGAATGLTLIAARCMPLLRLRKKITIIERFRIDLKSEIPFAPFMVLGAWLALVWQLDLLHVSNF